MVLAFLAGIGGGRFGRFGKQQVTEESVECSSVGRRSRAPGRKN